MLRNVMFFLFLFAFVLAAQTKYEINVEDYDRNPVDSALVTFGDSAKYTNADGAVCFYNPSIVGVTDDTPVVPEEFAVSEFYPNPVKANEVKFNVNSRSELSLKIYNVIGEEVASFDKIISGNNSVSLAGLSRLPAGVYFASLTDGKRSKAIKFVNLNSGSNPALEIDVAAAGFVLPAGKASPQETYIALRVEKEGFLTYEANVDTAQHDIYVTLNKAYKTISGAVLDNVKYPFGIKDTLEARVAIYYGESSEEQTGRRFEFQVPGDVEYLDSVKVAGVGEDSSFVLTERNFPVAGDMENLEFLVTAYDGLIYGHNVPDSIAVTVEQYEKMALEGIFARGAGDVGGLKGLNLSHVNNPIYENPDPTTEHGYEYVIPLTQMSDIDPNSLPWTEEQQQQVKEIIETDIQTKYPEEERIRVRILAANDTLPMFWSPEGYIRPYPGVFIVSRGTGGFSYSFAALDYNQDGWVDAAFVTLGGDFDTNLAASRQELHSVYITMPIWPVDIPGDVIARSIFLQSGYKSRDFTPSVDNKMINGLLMNMSEELFTYYNDNGTEKIKVNYLPKKPQSELLGTN